MNNSYIKILPDFIANQIAAGEVVQRPQSVVKELIENSIDAGATELAVIVKKAGKQLIHIVDNGVGMAKTDLLLSTKRHATSKVFTTEDLEAIQTFGFRGEALASISSVSNVEIRTKNEEDEHGWKLLSIPNQEPSVEAINCDKGSQVFVRNLFYNIPARKKFLRSDLTEFRHISDVMIKVSLAHINRRFTFYDNNNLVFDVHPEELKNRIINVLGKDYGYGMLKVNYEDAIFKIHGYIGSPENAKRTSSGQYLFLNKRPIINKSISYAVFSAYENLLEKSFKPQYVLYLEIDPSRIDINVHPQKHEVKFDDESLVHNTMKKAILDTLEKHNIVLEDYVLEKKSEVPFAKMPNSEADNDFIIVNTLTGEIIEKEANPFQNKHGGYQKSNYSYGSGSNQNPFRKNNDYSNEISAYTEVFNKKDDLFSDNTIEKKLPFNTNLPELNIWQFNRRYSFIKDNDKLIIIDILRAKQRILYEKLKTYSESGTILSQNLLFTIQIPVSIKEKNVLNEIQEELFLLGYDFSINGDDIEITSLPADLTSLEPSKLFREIIDLYSEYKVIRDGDIRDNIIAAISVKSVTTPKEALSHEETNHILTELNNSKIPYANPLGKKIYSEISVNEILAMFK